MKDTEWLKRESEKWVEDGIITTQQCSQIQLRYPKEKEGNPLLLFFAVIGSLLVGTGIILVFATNWWKLPSGIRVALAFAPLVAAQGLCLYTFFKKYDSAPFREGGAVLLSLAFFATVALIGQIFHTSSDMESYMLLCLLLTLPAAYFFRSRTAISIYVFGSLFSSWAWPVWVVLLIAGLSLPYFYFMLVHASRRRGDNYLLLLLSLLVFDAIFLSSGYWLGIYETMVLCSFAMLLIDALFRRLGGEYFFTSAKFLSIFIMTTVILTTALNLSYREEINIVMLMITAVIAIVYFVLRTGRLSDLSSTDLMLGAGIILAIGARSAGLTGFLLAIGLGIFYIVQGSRTLMLRKINYGMALIILIILMRFFDSALGLLGRGVLFILAGSVFLGFNLYISRKRKEKSA